MKTIHKAAAVVIIDNSFLMVRKVGADIWTSLGGHVEAGETPEQAVVREIKEEFNCDSEIIRKLGDFRANAAHDDAEVLLSTFLMKLKGDIDLIDPELEEYRFISKSYEKENILLPGSIKDHVIPYCIQEGLLNW
jgi:8-oxo-dGTP pyrophosphatase MutT (NUDIX family)